jgi:predicted nicotinamide N-methyase
MLSQQSVSIKRFISHVNCLPMEGFGGGQNPVQIKKSHPSNFEDIVESKLESSKTIALYRIELLRGKAGATHNGDVGCDGDGDDDNDNDDAVGFPAKFVRMLQNKAAPLFHSLKTLDESSNWNNNNNATTTSSSSSSSSSSSIPDSVHTNLDLLSAIKDMLFVLSLYRRIAELDVTLNDEVAMEGGHVVLSKLMKVEYISTSSSSSIDGIGNITESQEEVEDAVLELQETACQIAAHSPGFPKRVSRLTREELEHRLPLVYRYRLNKSPDSVERYGGHHTPPLQQQQQQSQNEPCEELMILVNQVTARQSEQKDVGFVLWPSAVVLSRWLILNQGLVQGKTVLELGAGCGLVGLVVATLNNDNNNTTILSDFNHESLKNLMGNLQLNGLNGIVKGVDFYEQDSERRGWLTTTGEVMDPVDTVLASDVICQPEDAHAVARTIVCALKQGGTCVVVSADSNHRFGVEQFEDACKLVGLDVSTHNVTDMMVQNQDSVTSHSRTGEIETTAGYVPSMKLTMYMICKPDI